MISLLRHALVFCALSAAMAAPSEVKIVRQNGRYTLLRNGAPYFTKGAVGAVHLDELARAGGNSIRAGVNSLDAAQARGLTVLADLPFAKQRTGFDYADPAALARQRQQILGIVAQYKDHPALLAWSVGNELEIRTTPEQRAMLWKEMNEVAKLIHAADPNHPVITPIGDAYRRMLSELNQYAPDLDGAGLNSYADMLTLPGDIAKQGWTRPYWVTEFGPRGHWQVAKTPWKLPIEDNSTEKAEFYRKAYEHAVASQPNCLGAYVFHWAQHHEKTHTWYGMFLEDGSRTEAVDVMTFLWSGKWPANRSPRIGAGSLSLKGRGRAPATVAPGAAIEAELDVTDPDGDPLAVTWDLRKDVSGNPNVGGDREEPTPPIQGAVISTEGKTARIRIPAAAGEYRLFAYAHDGHGNAATANLPLLAEAAGAQAAGGKRMVFEGAGAERSWPLAEFSPALAADWSGYDFFSLEMRLSSPQRFELRVHDASGLRAVRLSPVPNAWVRVAVPLDFLRQAARQGNDLASVHNKARAMLFLNLMGTPGPVSAVREIGFALPGPVGAVTLEVRALKLSKEDPGDALLDARPLVDQFGQWIPDEWPGKAASIKQLRAAWAAEEKALAPGGFGWCKFGGFAAAKAKATGFFRVEKVDGKWWIVDPDGHLFFSSGGDVMSPTAATSTQGREALFAALPPPVQAPGQRGGVSFHTWNLERRFGPGWAGKWVDLTMRRMSAWGFNTVGNWADGRLAAAHRMPYVLSPAGWGTIGPMGIVDAYAANFAEAVDRSAARQCDPHKDDPWLLGYFLGNEPPWPGRESVAVDALLAGPDSTTRHELKAWLAAGDTPERRATFMFQLYRKFVETVSAAIRRHDPNHLVLGLRFGGGAPEEVVRASRVFDVYSLNNYAYAVNLKEIEKVRSLIDKPILIGEFHFGTPGRGMTAGLKQTRDQAERGVAYRHYVENAAAHPSIVGAHWFQWVDEPATGRFDGENYNIGVVDVTDQPYPELVEAMKTTHKRLLGVHSGKEAPVTREARQQ